MEARSDSSYTWQSILAARDLIIAGTRWQVGSDSNVRIWKDRWIPLPLSFQIITAPNMLHPEATVAVLLDEVGEWTEVLIRAVFRPDDVDVILGITANSESPDHLRWHYEKNGRYSVKSGYRLLHQGLAPFVHGEGRVRHLIRLRIENLYGEPKFLPRFGCLCGELVAIRFLPSRI
ncbi:UNVERIFIED_CONTAM: hypothetical protein Slati_2359700 [Sesamum latifolium]|uniref:Uncharacterized protein n=1 Tax=Sesamum latifolium TaxID=2727402 RepID=A0AAW2WEN6_9LAMI